jgi:hypothetical protein
MQQTGKKNEEREEEEKKKNNRFLKNKGDMKRKKTLLPAVFTDKR